MLKHMTVFSSEHELGVLEAIQRAWFSFLWYGILMTGLGLLAIIYPVQTSIVFENVVGLLLLLMGLFILVSAITFRYSGHFARTIVFGVLVTAGGLFLILNPQTGLLTLTVIAAAIFLLDGAIQLLLAFDIRPHRGWSLLLFSGLASLLVGILIAAGLPGTSYYVMGLLIGIGVLTSGIATIILAIRLRNLPSRVG